MPKLTLTDKSDTALCLVRLHPIPAPDPCSTGMFISGFTQPLGLCVTTLLSMLRNYIYLPKLFPEQTFDASTISAPLVRVYVRIVRCVMFVMVRPARFALLLVKGAEYIDLSICTGGLYTTTR